MAEIFAATGLVLAAGISAVASVLVAKLRTDNTTQHQTNLDRLQDIACDVGEVKTDVREVRQAQNRHLEWHAERSESG